MNPLIELGMENLQTNLDDLSEGGSQYVGHLKFEMISISLLSKYQIEPIFHKHASRSELLPLDDSGC